MAQISTNNQTTATKAGTDRPLVPPEERFWQKYSPHYEFRHVDSGIIIVRDYLNVPSGVPQIVL